MGEAWGLCTVAAFVPTQGTMQPLLSDRVLMLVIVVVTASRGLREVPAVGGKSSALESETLGALQIHCLTLGSYGTRLSESLFSPSMWRKQNAGHTTELRDGSVSALSLRGLRARHLRFKASLQSLTG